jgi:hypothetical protein
MRAFVLFIVSATRGGVAEAMSRAAHIFVSMSSVFIGIGILGTRTPASGISGTRTAASVPTGVPLCRLVEHQAKAIITSKFGVLGTIMRLLLEILDSAPAASEGLPFCVLPVSPVLAKPAD